MRRRHSLLQPCGLPASPPFHTFVAFIDSRKNFDFCWVETTWFVSMTWASQNPSQSWVDSGVAQGRVLSTLLFNLLMDSLASSLRAAVPGVRPVDCDRFRHVCQLYADDVVTQITVSMIAFSFLGRVPQGLVFSCSTTTYNFQL